MNAPRTVTVQEHELVTVAENGESVEGHKDAGPWLTEAEAGALLRLNERRRGFCQRLAGGVKLAQYCGVVRLPTCVVEILPKVGMGDARTPDELNRARGALLAMLHSARQIPVTEISSVPQHAVQAPLLDIFIEAFLHCALEQARRGLLSRYVPHADDLPVVKGRFQTHGHVRRNLARPHLLYCEYEEFTADNAHNRAVRAALDACRGWIGRTATQRLWFETNTRYAGISSVRMSAADVARLPRERTNRRYAPLLTWCEWLLGMASPALGAGASQAPGLLFDMNKLFEAHVTKLVEVDAGSHRIVHTQGPPLHLGRRGPHDAFLLKPDITVWRTGEDGMASSIELLVDAKWKRLDPHALDFGVDAADVYQLLAYAVRYGCNMLELVFPMPDGMAGHQAPPTFHLIVPDRDDDITVKVRLVPLWMEEAPA